jgi:hypothetical protein
MAFIVVYDANAMYGNTPRDLLIRIGRAGLVQAKWTEDILDEALGSLVRNRPDITQEKLARLRELINSAIPDCLVTGYEPLIEGLKLPDPQDRHVLAAAIKAGAQVIVTANLKHFPAEILSHGLSRRNPRTTSCSTRSASTTGPYSPASKPSQTHATSPLRPSMTSSAS